MKKSKADQPDEYDVEMMFLKDRRQAERDKRKDKAFIPCLISGVALGIFMVTWGKGLHLAIPGIPYTYFLFRFFDYWPALSEDPRIGLHWEYLRVQDMFRQAGGEGRAGQLALLLFLPFLVPLFALFL